MDAALRLLWERGLCAGQAVHDPRWDSEEEDVAAELGRSVCMFCPVQTECLNWALTNIEPSGIWAGTTPLQRQEIRHERYYGDCREEVVL